MKKLMMIAAASTLAATMTGCLIPANHDVAGSLVMDHSGALMMPVDNSVKPEKRGEAKVTGIIGITSGDCSIAAAMKDGGITKIHHIDYHTKNILGLVGEYRTIVWGE